MLLAVACPVCGARGAAPCAVCAAGLRPAPALPAPAGVEACHALLAYDGPGRRLVAGLKYANHRAALPALAAAMAALVDPGGVDAVTWLPTTPSRRRRRGFDQAELLARAVARRLDRPARRLLVRVEGPAQTGRSRADRRMGPALATPTGLRAHRGPPPARVLLVDDVVTTGASVAAGAAALRGSGTRSVVVLAAARTPRLKAVPARDDP